VEQALYNYDPRVNAHGLLSDALQEFVGYMYRDGEVCVPPVIAFERMGERALLVASDLPRGWLFWRYRRLSRSMFATAALGVDRGKPRRMRLAARVSNHLRVQRRLAQQLLP
jgi:hypothetical protein